MEPSTVIAFAIAIGSALAAIGMTLGWQNLRRHLGSERGLAEASTALIVVATALTAAFVIGPRRCCFVWPLVAAEVAFVISLVTLAASWRGRYGGLASSSVVLLAFSISGIYWNLLMAPKEVVSDTLGRVLRYLDLAPALFGRALLPDSWDSAFHAFFRQGTYCFPGPPWWEAMRYFRTGVAAYALVLGIPLIVLFRRRSHARGQIL